MTILQDLKALDLAEAHVNLWTVKGPTGPAAADPRYSGHWVETTDAVDNALRETLTSDLGRIEEVLEYGLLAQNNEASALHVPADETHAPTLLIAIGAEIPRKKVSKVKHLLNSKFYVAKFMGIIPLTYV